MNTIVIIVLLLLLFSYSMNYYKSKAVRRTDYMPNTPFYYGSYGLLLIFIPNLVLVILWLISGNTLANLFLNLTTADTTLINQIDQSIAGINLNFSVEVLELAKQKTSIVKTIDNIIIVLVALIGLFGACWSYYQIYQKKQVGYRIEKIVRGILFSASTISILTTVGIVISLLFEAIRFFSLIPIHQFLFGLEWQPQTAIRADQIGSSGSFGFLPVLAGTLLISLIAMIMSVPIGLFAAIYMSEYAHSKTRTTIKPILEILAGIPTVVYGFFAVLVIAPQLRSWGESIGLSVASESALAAGLVMGIMLIPFISSLSDDIISAVPNSLREGSYGLGATKSETIKNVILPAALPGVASAILLAFSRAIGETMIVVMAAGLAANLTVNPLEAVTTITVQIVTLLVGDQEFDSAKTLAAFALGLTLFIITLLLNIISLKLVNRYREKYD